MYIKSIKIQGFKSFADKLNIELNPGMSAIVGPNGSGKSNVVDSILWCLGEQSVKTLRGDSSMSDIIFSGSKNREGLNKATVSILFDNSDHILAADLNEIEIKRVIYKTGENEYFINNSKVRLKDIVDMLMDVSSKFNIISQGNIAALVENKSSERRILFENAAGVLKYKKRKEESLKKLEGTKENLVRINLITKELNETLTPLEGQRKDALKYLDIKKNLENIEVSLTVEDITSFTKKLNNLKSENESTLSSLSKIEVSKPDEVERKKLECIKIDEEIFNFNNKLSLLNDEISSLTSEKEISKERIKYNLDKEQVNTSYISLMEEKANKEKNINELTSDFELEKSKLTGLVNEFNDLSNDLLKTKIEKSNLDGDINRANKDILILQNKINIEKENLENNLYLPKSVSSVINNPRLSGIHNTIGNLIEINDAHLTAINTALGASSNFIVANDMSSIKKSIEYLKDNALGRATFFPIDTIKSRKLDLGTIEILKNYNGFIGVASDLVSFDHLYKDIIENQLGNVLVVDSVDDLFFIAKKCDYKYKMVSLEGEIVYPGGSVAGGRNEKKAFNKSNLNELVKMHDDKENLLKSLTNRFNELTKKYNDYNEKYDDLQNKINALKVNLGSREDEIKIRKDELSKILSSLEGILDIKNNNIENHIEEIINNITLKEEEKVKVLSSIKDLQSKKFDLTNEISSLEKEIANKNSEYHSLENKMASNNVEIAKLEVRIDNLLNILKEDYQITYEYALNNYTLNMEESLARESLSRYRSELKRLSNVNVGSIAEYDRLKKRFDFLSKQKEDLENSSNELLKVIEEMDIIMKEKFESTFKKIAIKFEEVFKKMFKGGSGKLVLSNEDDILNSGIDIIAVPPGKRLSSTTMLSGGEKALTAICLIFSILEVKPAPFIVLDEAEAALDEENVSMFGEYLQNMKNKSQFILITHKKKMMEYADILYGITMQESGVSKLVSVKLEN